MSSITCYESENLTIVGAEGEWIGGCTSESVGDCNTKTIRLHFSILINGRIKNFYHEFSLEKQPNGIVDPEDTCDTVIEKMNRSEDTYLSLKNWFGWNTLLETMKPLGYMGDIGYREIQTWIDKLYQQK